MFTAPARITRTAILHMQRHGWHTLAALSVMTLTFFMLSLFILTLLASNQVLRYFETQPLAIVYFKDEATTAQIESLKADLMATGQVKEVVFTSKEQALGYFKQDLANQRNDEVLDSLPEVSLPASIDIAANNIEDLSVLMNLVNDPKYHDIVEEVRYNQDVAERLASWIATGRVAGLILIGFLLTVSFLIMLVTIGLNIAAFRDEIEIMRLVGAGNWYIRGPFFLEGILYGVISAILAVTIVYASLPWLANGLQSWLAGIDIFPIAVLPVFGGLLLGQMLFGTVLGILGSSIAMRRSLNT